MHWTLSLSVSQFSLLSMDVPLASHGNQRWPLAGPSLYPNSWATPMEREILFPSNSNRSHSVLLPRLWLARLKSHVQTSYQKRLGEEPHLSLKANWEGFSQEKRTWILGRQESLVPIPQYARWPKYMNASSGSTLGRRRQESFLSPESSSKWKFPCRVHRAELGECTVGKEVWG